MSNRGTKAAERSSGIKVPAKAILLARKSFTAFAETGVRSRTCAEHLIALRQMIST